MDRDVERNEQRTETPAATPWQRPSVEVINLACEISAYAPDDGGPLF